MIKIEKRLLKEKGGKTYYNNIEFTGISYSSMLKPGLSNSVEYGCIEEEFIDGFKTGVCTKYYPEQRICMRYTRDNAIESRFVGKFETYYINGQICELGEFENNKLHGNYECFYEDGSPFIKAYFNKDSLTGNGTSFYRNGAICEDGVISDVVSFTRALELRLYFGKTPTQIEGHLQTYGIPYADHWLNELMYSRSGYDFCFNSLNNVRGNYKSLSVDGKIIVHIKDLIKETFDINGKRLMVGAFNEHGQEHGQVIKYSYGNLDQIESFLNGTLHGLFLKCNYNGLIKLKGEYYSGSKMGKWTTYYENGLLESEKVYLDSTQYLYTDYYNNQKIKREGKVANGLNDGLFREFHENGSLHVEITYQNGKIVDGEIKYFYDNCNKKAIHKYKNGELDGFSFSYYDNGNVKTKRHYSKGKRAGLFEHYYESGALKVKGNFKIGVYGINDDFVFFNEDGFIIEKPEEFSYFHQIFNDLE